MVQASINNERDFDRVADALIIQHPRIHLQESRKRAKGQGKDGIKRRDNSNTRWFQEKGTHTGSEISGSSAYYANFTSVQDYGHDDDTVELADAFQAHNDPADPGSDVGEEALDCDDNKENDTFSSYVALDDVSVFEAAELDAIALLADTWDNDLDPEVSAQCKLTFPSERRKVRAKARARANFLFTHHVFLWRIVDND